MNCDEKSRSSVSSSYHYQSPGFILALKLTSYSHFLCFLFIFTSFTYSSHSLCVLTSHKVLMNGAECDFIHNDPLKQLSYDSITRIKFLGAEADVNYRAALEVSRTGELSLRVPEELPIDIEKPKELPRGVPKDVSVRYDKLLKVCDFCCILFHDYYELLKV